MKEPGNEAAHFAPRPGAFRPGGGGGGGGETVPVIYLYFFI